MIADFDYNPKRAESLYVQLALHIKELIDSGLLKPGYPLPPTRELSATLNLSRDTVTNTYRELMRLGYIGTDSTRRTYVLAREKRPNSKNVIDADTKLARKRLSAFGKQMRDEVLRHPSTPSFSALNYGAVPRSALPMRRWREIMQGLCVPDTFKKLEYEPSVIGRKELRVAISDYLSRTKSIACDWEQVAIFSISSGLIDALCRLLLEPGATVAVEEPGYGAVKNIAKSQGLNLLPIGIDREGLRVDLLKSADVKISMVYVTAAHHDPTGVIMSLSRRKELIEWAKAKDVWIIEDDYDGHFYYAGPPPASLWGLNPNDNVIYSSTFWQVLYPLTTIGYAVLPANLVPIVRAAKELRTEDISDYMVQMVLTQLIGEGYLEKHLRRVQKPFARKRIALIHELKKHFGAAIDIRNESAGNYFTFVLNGYSELKVEESAAFAGLPVTSTASYYLERSKAGEFLINFALLEETEIRQLVMGFVARLKNG